MQKRPLQIRSSMLVMLADFASRRGLELRPLVERTGIDPSAVDDPLSSIPLENFSALLEDVGKQIADPCIGLTWAEAFPAGGTGPIGHLMLNAGTVRDALKELQRYIGLIIHPFDIEFSEEGGEGVLSYRWPESHGISFLQGSVFFTALLCIRIRRAAGGKWDPLLVEMPHRQLACEQQVRRVLGPHVEYNAGRSAIHIEAKVLARDFAPANPMLHSMLKRLGDQMLAEISDADDPIAVTKKAILELLEDGNVTLETVSRQIHVSPRMLQSRLAQLDRTFESVLNETRSQLATHYLQQTDLSMTEIALRLGFSEPSAFTRAAQRWFGETPSAARHRLKSLAKQQS